MNVVINLLGTHLDAMGRGPKRWDAWRPSVALAMQEDFRVDRYHLIYSARFASLAREVMTDIAHVSPETKIVPELIEFSDPWDFEEVYGKLYDFARGLSPKSGEQVYVNISTGTHVAQICFFLLVESRHLPAKIIQTSPSKNKSAVGAYTIIDLDLSRYDLISKRFQAERREGIAFLKSGIDTRNAQFNRLIETIETVAVRASEPLLLTGPTGAGKSRLARCIHELKRQNNQVTGRFVELNCATLRGDGAMSTLFGHVKGAFTGAVGAREGLLREADRGILFLDEVGELGLDEQAMLLRAVEDGVFLPFGSDREVSSRFQLICGTNRELRAEVRLGRFREDLLARINLWTFRLPGLAERREDIGPNLDYELERYAKRANTRVTFNREARERFLQFAVSDEAEWRANFRDLSAAVTRMATLAPGGRIDAKTVAAEIERLRETWRGGTPGASPLAGVLGPDEAARFDRFDLVQLADVVTCCRASENLSDAGRALFAVSRQSKSTSNDADRLRKYLARFGLTWQRVKRGTAP
ncbi:MAG: RNA repair transcriptional activator RtcR [Verrucomicrobiota bacterium]|jgi:transcriptional regulatory protein RtcR|nr:RNA repair transcriptional activator RtcR [Verrucomicrobiota bacterium]